MDVSELAAGVMAGDRRTLSRAITLVESTRADHRQAAEALIEAIGVTGADTLRVGLTGTPGVGKSSFIERFGLQLIEAGHRVAVLAVDPSSARTGGSILGDKTRMEVLTRRPEAFIRPSPSQTALGGVARRTREAALLCEAAGFDVVLIETVGVGQSETLVAEMTDLFVLLIAPAGGDELQGVKRGIMEMADLILVNKSDGDLLPAARRTAADYSGALRLLRARPGDPAGYPKVALVSALTGAGLEMVWTDMQALTSARRDVGTFDQKRADQRRRWFDQIVEEGLLAHLTSDLALRAEIERLAKAVADGRRTPSHAARDVLKTLQERRTGSDPRT